MSETRTFNHTTAALIEFDAGAAKRAQAWDTVETNADLDAAELAEAHALRAVQEAFRRDTAEINSLVNCYRFELGFMRRMAAKAATAAPEPQQAEPDDSDDQTDAPAPR